VPDIATTVQGNWFCTADVVHESASTFSYVRVNGSKKECFKLTVYSTKESTEILDQFRLIPAEKTSVQFGRNSDSLQSIKFIASLGPHYSTTGTWERSFFNAVVVKSTVVTITMVRIPRTTPSSIS
jgi:hypothetical protein